MVVSWRLFEAPKTHLEEGPSRANMLQVGQERASTGNQAHLEQLCCDATCELLQGTRSTRAPGYTHFSSSPSSRAEAQDNSYLMLWLIRWCLSPNSSPTCILLFQPHAPALHQPWHFAGSSFTTQFLSVNQQQTHSEKNPKTPQCFQLGQVDE